MKKVCVLLAAYNGEKYISEQIETILHQKGIGVDIYISLDNSNDSTQKIIKSYSIKHHNIYLLSYGKYFGGAAKNFYHLFKNVDFTKYDYISLADQDDIWHVNKIISAIREIEATNSSALSSDVIAYWSESKQKIIKKSQPQKLSDYLFESPGPGCSFVITQEVALLFKNFLIENEKSESIEYHDWLLYAFVRSKGIIWKISSNPLMFYRQHEDNQIGANSGIKSLLYRLKKINDGWYRGQVELIMETLGYKGDLYMLIKNKSYLNNLRLALYINDLRRAKGQTLFLFLCLVLNVF